MILTINLLLDFAGRLNISAKMDRQHFYRLGNLVVQILNKNNLTQKARDLSEELFILSIEEHLPHYGFYIQYKCYLEQKNIQDTLFYLCCFIENNRTQNLNLWLDSLLSTQKILRDFSFFEFEEEIYNYIITNYKENIKNRDYIQLHLSHFASQLKEGEIDLIYTENFLNSNKEKIFRDGLDSFISWYILLNQICEIYKSPVLINYLNNFSQFIPKNIRIELDEKLGNVTNFKIKYNDLFEKLSQSVIAK